MNKMTIVVGVVILATAIVTILTRTEPTIESVLVQNEIGQLQEEGVLLQTQPTDLAPEDFLRITPVNFANVMNVYPDIPIDVYNNGIFVGTTKIESYDFFLLTLENGIELLNVSKTWLTKTYKESPYYLRITRNVYNVNNIDSPSFDVFVDYCNRYTIDKEEGKKRVGK
ncbi:MAG: hypothetical protein EBS86_16315, partial [Crocinitomicaceae bacterium]|nr:hypothetical protein [Crocinitomicaceae bacterium]